MARCVPDARLLQGVAQEGEPGPGGRRRPRVAEGCLSLGVTGSWNTTVAEPIAQTGPPRRAGRPLRDLCKTEDKGRLVHLMPDGPTPVLASYEKELIRDSVEHKKLEQVLVKCGEFECVQLDGDSSVTFRA